MRRLSNFLLGLGAAIGLGGVLGLMFGDQQSARLAQILDFSTHVLVFVAAGCAFVAGALLGRAAAKREEADLAESELLQLYADVTPSELAPRQAERTREHVS